MQGCHDELSLVYEEEERHERARVQKSREVIPDVPHGEVRRTHPSRHSHLLIDVRDGRNLMAKDEFKNLGFGDEKPVAAVKKEDEAEQGQKGELRW